MSLFKPIHVITLLVAVAQAAPVLAQVAPNSSAIAPRSYHEGFESAFVPVPTTPIAPNSPSVVRGHIPAGWTEDSTYPDANVAVRYSQIADAAAGKGALRMETERVTTGNSGLRWDNLQLAANTFYRLRITARSAAGSSASLALRSAAPHKNYWSQSISPGPEWTSFDFIVPPLAAEDKTAQFIIVASRPAQMDFDEFSLVPIRDDEVGADFKGQGNLLPLSSFPVGLAKPWIASHLNIRDEDYVADPAVLGPSGLPSLRITSRHLANLGVPYFESRIMVPFAGKPNAIHTFSAYLKGAKNGQMVKLRLVPPIKDAGPTYVKSVTLTTNWQRYEFTVKLPYVPQNYYIASITSNGHTPQRETERYWVDQAQVEVGDKAMPFQRPAPVEVALVSAKKFGLHIENEPLLVDATIYGDVKPNTLLGGTFYDARNRAFPVKAQSLRAGRKLQTLRFVLPRGAELPFGFYRFVAQAKQGQNTVSKLGEISLGRVRRARLRDVFAPQSPFGIHAPENASHLQLAQDLGFKWIRTLQPENMVWNEIEQPEGHWDWSRQDRAVQLYRNHKFSIMGMLGTGPSRYSTVPNNALWGLWQAKVKEENLPRYEEYARRIATRYKGIITEWETHNETDLPSYFYDAVVDGKKIGGKPEDFTVQHKTAYRGLKAADPNIRVWWNMAWARPAESKAFAEGATKAGIWDYVEAFSYHNYNGNYHAGPGNALEKRIDEVRSVMPENKKHLSLWNTEGGFWPNEIRDLTPQVPPFISAERNAFFGDYVARYYIFTLAQGVEKFFLFSLLNGGYDPGHEVLNADGSVSQLLLSFSNLAWHLEGKKFSQMVPLSHGINAYLFSDGKSSVAVLLSSSAGRLSLAQAPPGISVRDSLGNDVAFPARIGDEPTYWSSDNLSAAELERRLKTAFGAR